MKNFIAYKYKTKEFFKYLFSSLKKGKFLLIEGVVIAVLYSIISVMSNLLDISQLTYLNSFLSLSYFSFMLSFGISQGISIFVNQNINNKARVEKSVKTGFELITIISLIFTSVMMIFPKLFMEIMMGYTPSDYTFYYLMCIYFFINCLAQYIEDILKKLEIFKWTFLSNATHLTIILLGFVILYVSKIYLLNYIAIAYILGAVTLFSLYFTTLLKKSEQKINLFKLTKINLTKRQWIVIASNFSIEVVWQVGYYAISVFLMHTGDDFFNTYSYLESVLDIFNCIYFTFTTITSIEIAHSLGQDDFQTCKKHARYSIYGTIIIWLFHTTLSLLLIYPIALGVADEYFSLMFTALLCYVVLQLFRFINWNFSSYMLRLGGKENLPIMVMTIVHTFYLISICFLANMLPKNIFFSYFMIILPEMIELPIYIFIYKGGKWMNNINKDPNLLSNKIKCFIFDFDDTLYYGVDWSEWNNMQKSWIRNHFSNLKDQEFEELVKQNLNGKICEGKNIIELLIKVEGSAKAYVDWRNSIDGEMSEFEKKGQVVPMEEIKKFRAQCDRVGGKMYIVTNSTLKGVEAFSKYYNIDLSLFDEILANEYHVEDVTKKRIYQEILDKNNFKNDEVMVVGNSYKSDILPAKKIKLNTFLCRDGFTYEEVVEL